MPWIYRETDLFHIANIPAQAYTGDECTHSETHKQLQYTKEQGRSEEKKSGSSNGDDDAVVGGAADDDGDDDDVNDDDDDGGADDDDDDDDDDGGEGVYADEDDNDVCAPIHHTPSHFTDT